MKTTFEVNGTIYKSNENNTYFYKSTGSFDKKGNPLMMRISRAVYEKAFDELTNADDNGWDIEDEVKERKVIEEKEAKKAEKAVNKKSKKISDSKLKKAHWIYREDDKVVVTLTTKQANFLYELTHTRQYNDSDEYNDGIWCDILMDEIGGEFAGRPMTAGAIVSTLKEKGIFETGVERVNGHKAKYIKITSLGHKVLVDMALA